MVLWIRPCHKFCKVFEKILPMMANGNSLFLSFNWRFIIWLFFVLLLGSLGYNINTVLLIQNLNSSTNDVPIHAKKKKESDLGNDSVRFLNFIILTLLSLVIFKSQISTSLNNLLLWLSFKGLDVRAGQCLSPWKRCRIIEPIKFEKMWFHYNKISRYCSWNFKLSFTISSFSFDILFFAFNVRGEKSQGFKIIFQMIIFKWIIYENGVLNEIFLNII